MCSGSRLRGSFEGLVIGIGNIEILRAENGEILEECLKIRETVFTKEKNVPKEIEADAFDVLNGSCAHFLIKADGENVGTFRCLELPGAVVRLQRFCVLPGFRNHGIGKRALGYIENNYVNKSRIVLDAQVPASGFYEKGGYERVSEEFMEAGIPHIKMEKKLKEYSTGE